MYPRVDYTGAKFGKLTVISEASPKIRKDRNSKIRRLNCQCTCGNEAIVSVPDLKSGNTLSCGCYKIEATKKSNTTHGQSISVGRGGKATSEYQTWCGMIQRCEYEKHISWPWYGARGIKVCKRWRASFEDFLADMGCKPSPDLTIEREDGDGNYEPGNCKWATSKEQFASQRKSPEFIAHMKKRA